MAFCQKCDREVGIVTKSRAAAIFGCLILGLLVPLWIITLPFFWGLALLLAILPREKLCGICKAPISSKNRYRRPVGETSKEENARLWEEA